MKLKKKADLGDDSFMKISINQKYLNASLSISMFLLRL